MTRTVTLELDDFGQRSLDRLVKGGSASAAEALRTAARYYLRDRDSERAAWRAPRFRSVPTPSPRLDVGYDDGTWDALEAEAVRQGVKPEQLAVHALMYFLADLDSGRAAAFLDERGEEP